ncbi:MAG: cell division protein FtsA, partial [Anaerolineae bacterium]|nr:cell division protein FtsA [Anaerolineae bacterium]
IDVGTTKICVLIGEVVEHGGLRIVGMGEVASRGLDQGVVVNVREATRAIAEAVRQAEQFSGYPVERVWVGVAGAHVAAVNSRAAVAVANPRRGVTREDKERVLRAARTIAIPHNRDIIHVIPRSYTVDEQPGIADPEGMQGYRLEVEAHVVTGAATAISNLVRCVEGAEVEVEGLVLQVLASAEAVLTPQERKMGAVLADIGGGTTDIGVFINDSICHTVVLPVAGNHLTNDLAIGLRAPFTTAEEVKRRFGHAMVSGVPEGEAIEVALFGDSGRQPVLRSFVAEILEARAEEILMLIMREVKRSGFDGLLPAGLVLCGGSANLAGLRELGRAVLGVPTRVGVPRGVEGLVEKVSDPAYATSVGILLWALRETRTLEALPTGRRESGLWARIAEWLRTFLPE